MGPRGSARVLGAGLVVCACVLAGWGVQARISHRPAPAAPEEAVRPTVPATTAPAPAPALTMACPTGGAQSSPVFAHRISATRPYTVTVDYGDGDHYSTDDRYLDAAFTHAYRSSGTFTVTAALTDATGRTATASCAYTWAAPAPPPSSAVGAARSAATSSSAPATGPFVRAGGQCVVQGAPGVTADGTPVVCDTTATDPVPRWRSS